MTKAKSEGKQIRGRRNMMPVGGGTGLLVERMSAGANSLKKSDTKRGGKK